MSERKKLVQNNLVNQKKLMWNQKFKILQKEAQMDQNLAKVNIYLFVSPSINLQQIKKHKINDAKIQSFVREAHDAKSMFFNLCHDLTTYSCDSEEV